ncbi:MAG: hypothetical protein EBU90_02670, partial [Proteobacteria bacterium]|nr:hypothetical protein [Pseudomonadota bacterium]NBP13140.1 hypothetical protein [bacterium]
MPPSRNNTVKFTDLQAISSVNIGDIIPVVDTSVPTLVNKKINVQDFSRSLPVSQQLTQVGTVSANWNNVYTTVNSNSAGWESVESTVLSNSANWNRSFNITTSLQNLTSGFLPVSGGTLVGSVTAAISKELLYTVDLFHRIPTAVLINTTVPSTTTCTKQPGSINGRYYFAYFGGGGSNLYVYWDGSRWVLSSNSPSIGGGIQAYNTSSDITQGTWVSLIPVTFLPAVVVFNNFKYIEENDLVPTINAISNIASTSATWVLKTGDQMSGSLTTTKTTTAEFTDLNEFVSKRYVDAVAGVSGNFVPSLYYAKTDFTTGVPTVCATNLQASKLTFNRSGASTSFNNPLIPVSFADNTYFISDAYNWVRTGPGPSIILGSYLDQASFATRINGVNNTYNLWVTRDSSVCWGNNDPIGLFNEQADLFLFRDAPYTLAIRDRAAQTTTNALRVYNNYVNSTTNFERFGLSGNRLAYELSGSQRFYIGSTTANGIIAWANNINGFNTLDVYNQADWQFARNGSTTHVLRAGGSFETRAFGNGLTIDDGTGVRGGILFDSADTVGIRNSTNSQNLRIYNTYTNATNYERLSLSATRIAYEFAGTGVSRDLTIQSTGNLILSAGASIQLSQALPFQISPLSSSNLTAPNGIDVVTGSGATRGIFATDQYGHGVYSESGGISLRCQGGGYNNLKMIQANPYPVLWYEYGGVGFFAANQIGKIGLFRGANNLYRPSFTPAVSAHVTIVTDSTMNSHVSDMLLLSAGPNVSISNYINCVSAGQTIFSVNSTGSVFYNTFSNNTFDSFGVVRFPADGTIIQTDGTGGRSGWNNVSVNNYAANNGNAALASAKGQWNFPSVINAPTAFTLNNQIYLLNDPTNTQLISVSSNRGKVGFRFEPVEIGNNRPEIY